MTLQLLVSSIISLMYYLFCYLYIQFITKIDTEPLSKLHAFFSPRLTVLLAMIMVAVILNCCLFYKIAAS